MRNSRMMRGRARARRLAALAALLGALLWSPSAEARWKASGAGGCGDFSDAVTAAEDGDVLTPMFDGGEGRNSQGAVITKNLYVEGRWSPPGSGCTVEEETYDTVAQMLAAGFTYGGPANRAKLFAFGAPAITLDPAVKSFTMLYTDLELRDDSLALNGGGLAAAGLSGANIRLEQVGFFNDQFDPLVTVNGNGAGLFLDVDGGSRVTIADSQFSGLRSTNGGGFEIVVRGGSQVTLSNVQVTNNNVGGSGGGGRIILYSGVVSITDSLFSGNQAGGSGGALRIERPVGATGQAEVRLINTRFSGNAAPTDPDVSTSGNGLVVRTINSSIWLPVAIDTRTPSSRLDKITRSGNQYVCDFETGGFQPQLPGQHVHFFFNTVPPSQAGVPGAGPWFVYGGGSPFTGYGVADRLPGATEMCVLVANPDHTVIPGTGNCLKLP